MKVSDIMTKGAETVAPTTSVRDAANRMAEADIGALPVAAEDRLVGMVTDRDIAVRGVAAGRPIELTTVEDVMSTGILYLRADDDVVTAADSLADKQVRRMPVVDADKRLVGMVALADLARAGAEAGRTAAGIVAPTSAARS